MQDDVSRSPDESAMESEGILLSRRSLWQGAGMAAAAVGVAGAGIPGLVRAAEKPADHPGYDAAVPRSGAQTAADYPVSSLMTTLSRYISEARDRPLPPEVVEKTKWHILDSLAAVTMGSQTPAGSACRSFARENAGDPVSTVIGSSRKCDPMTTAMLNGTMGHSHEADDTGGKGGPWHPGVNVVPAALALGERYGTGGMHFLRAVTLGYDIGGRVGTAAGLLRNFKTPTVSVCGYFGAAAASACILAMDDVQARQILSYTAQQSSGIDSFRRDPDHIEKGFMNGGMGARGGVTSALLVRAGFTGVRDMFSGPANFFALFRAAGLQVDPNLLIAELGSRYDVMAANFKRRPVAGAISAVLDSLEALIARQPIDPDAIAEIIVRYEPNSVTDNSGPVDVNMQHAVAMTLVDKKVTMRSIQDLGRFNDPRLVRLRSVTTISPVVIYVQTGKFVDPSAPGAAAALGSKVPVIQIKMVDGTRYSQGDVPARGESNDPYTQEWVVAKARSLMTPVLGSSATDRIIDLVLTIDTVHDVRALSPLLRVKRDTESRHFSNWPYDTDIQAKSPI